MEAYWLLLADWMNSNGDEAPGGALDAFQEDRHARLSSTHTNALPGSVTAVSRRCLGSNWALSGSLTEEQGLGNAADVLGD